MADESPKSTNFGVSPRTELLAKSILSRGLTSATSAEICFQTNYDTEIGRRVAIYGRKSINGSVKWLGIPAPFCDTGMAWTENILGPSPFWVDRVTYATWVFGTQSVVLVRYGVLWRSVVSARPFYLPKSPPEMCAQLRAASVTFSFGITV